MKKNCKIINTGAMVGYSTILMFVLLSFIHSTFPKNDSTTLANYRKSHRKGKFWGFGIGFVRFENSLCTGSDGLDGTCYTRWQCKSIDGIFSGKCANVGTCCVVQQSCGGISSYNNTYFVNPKFPQTYSDPGSCSFTVEKCNSDICQIRIDFLSLTLSQPGTNGVCNFDALSITGGATRFTPICGENSGQHVYIAFSGSEDIKITIITSPMVTSVRSWKLKIAQIGCSCPTRAPSGCLQYFTAASGTVSSFNFGSAVVSPATRQIANTNYGICVAKIPGNCEITWSQSSGVSFAFSVSGNTTIREMPPDCMSDYVVIPNSGMVDRFCGNTFTPLTSSRSPFILMTVTNDNEVDDEANRGFSLSYTQGPCGVSTG